MNCPRFSVFCVKKAFFGGTAFFYVAAALPVPAKAQEDPRRAQAETLFQEGLALHDKDQEDGALEKFERSYAIYPSPNTLVSVGREEQLLKRPRAALRHYREAMKQPLLNPKFAQLAKMYISELEVRFAKVSVNGPAGTTILMRDESFRLPLEEPVDTEPGSLSVVGRHEGRRFEGAGLAVAGKVLLVDLKELPTEAVEKTIPVAPAVRSSSPGEWTTGKTIGVLAGAASLASLGAFVGSRVVARAKGSEVDEAAKEAGASGGCLGVNSPVCDRVNSSAASERDWTNASTGFLIGGIALAGGAAASFLFWPTSKRIVLTPQLSATSRTIAVSGSF